MYSTVPDATLYHSLLWQHNPANTSQGLWIVRSRAATIVCFFLGWWKCLQSPCEATMLCLTKAWLLLLGSHFQPVPSLAFTASTVNISRRPEKKRQYPESYISSCGILGGYRCVCVWHEREGTAIINVTVAIHVSAMYSLILGLIS